MLHCLILSMLRDYNWEITVINIINCNSRIIVLPMALLPRVIFFLNKKKKIVEFIIC